MAKKSKKRARQAARRSERREKKAVAPVDPSAQLLNRIFREARDRHESAAYEREQLRKAEVRRDERARARGERFDDPSEDDWLDDWKDK